MAFSHTHNLSTSGNNGLAARVLITITDDAAGNKSTVKAVLQARKTNGYSSSGPTDGDLRIGSTNFAISGNKTIAASSSWTTIREGSVTYSHNAAGQITSDLLIRVINFEMDISSDFDTPVNGSYTIAASSFTNYTRLPGVPGAPVPTILSPTSVKFAWAAATSPVSPVSYGQYLGLDSGFASHAVTATWLPDGVREYTYTGLQRGRDYWFRTRARSSEGTGPYTAAVKVTMPHTVPDKPAAPSVVNITQTGAKVDTTDPAYVGAAVTGRETQIRDGATVVATSTSVDPTFNSLTRSKAFKARYRVQNAQGWSEWSNETSFTTLGAPPSAPTGYTIFDKTATSAKVTAGTIADNGGAVPSRIRVKVSTTESDVGLVATFTQNVWAAILLYGLEAGETYYIAEAAFNTANNGGWGPYGSWVPMTMLSNVPSEPFLEVDSLTSSTATLVWTEPLDLNGADITAYKLRVATNQALTTGAQEFTLASDALAQVVGSLTDGQTYWAVVWTESSNGLGSFSEPVSFTIGGGEDSGSGIWLDIAGTPKFAEVWLDVGGTPKLCEVWIDVGGTPKLAVA